MKLYATVESERAKKGQGGDYLDIDITDEDEFIVAQFKVHTKNDGHGLLYYIDTVIREDVYVDGHHWIDSEIVKKGERQKGECNARQWSKTCKGCEFCKRTIEQD